MRTGRIRPFTALDVATSTLQGLIDDRLVADFTMEIIDDGVQMRLMPTGRFVSTLRTAACLKLPYEFRAKAIESCHERTKATEQSVRNRQARVLATAERVQRRDAWVASVLRSHADKIAGHPRGHRLRSH